MEHRHLVVGATGVAGSGIVRHLAGATDDPVFALSRSGRVPPELAARVRGLAADLLDPAAVAAALAEAAPTCVYHAAHRLPEGAGGDLNPRHAQLGLRLAAPAGWLAARLPTPGRALYAEINARAGLVDGGENEAMLRNLLGALGGGPTRHVAVVTGGRLHGVHLAPSLWPAAPAVLDEDSPRHPGPSWTFGVEDALAELGQGAPWSWSVHRPHFILGTAEGASHSLVNALGVYAALCRAAGRPLVFLGGPGAWGARSEAVHAELLGAQMRWAAREPRARGQAFLVSDGAPWRWPEVWAHLARRFGIAPELPRRAMALGELIPDAEAVWRRVRPEVPLGRVFPRAFLHQAMAMTWPLTYRVDKCRAMGFTEARDPLASLDDGLDRLAAQGLLPGAGGGE